MIGQDSILQKCSITFDERDSKLLCQIEFGRYEISAKYAF
jgi:hypothetical protein